MALAGDEKRIQGLFSETAFQDRSAAPTFEELWASAAMKTSAPPRSLSRLLLVATAALLVAAVSSGAWYWSSTRSSQHQTANVAPQTVSPPAPQQVAPQTNQIPADTLVKSRPFRPNKRRLRQSDRPTIAEAALLSRWQSPTRIFMDSPATVDFSSLPQLNQSAEKLRQFLPRNTELTKESN